METPLLLIVAHIIGTILGVGGATLAEVNLITALRDGKVDDGERRLMHANYMMLRVGLGIVVLSGIGIVWWHLAQGNEAILQSSKMWFKNLLVLFIIINAVCISKRWVPLWLGAGVSFTAWWMATILGLWRNQPFDFWELLSGFLIITLLVSGVLELIHRIFIPKKS